VDLEDDDMEIESEFDVWLLIGAWVVPTCIFGGALLGGLVALTINFATARTVLDADETSMHGLGIGAVAAVGALVIAAYLRRKQVPTTEAH
jgi:hypothetical protein